MAKKIKTILIFILVFLAIVAVNKFFYSQLKNSLFSIFSPLQKFFWGENNILLENIDAFFRAKKREVENIELKKENLFLKSEVLRLKEAEKENEKLREVFSAGPGKEFKLILAEVISKKVGEDSILVNRGYEDGIVEGMTAISKEKILIGRVSRVFKDFAEVELISQKDFSFSVEVEAESAEGWQMVIGAAKGEGDFKARVELLPKEVSLKEGGLVSTSLLGGIFPKGLLVGKIKNIRKTDVEPFQSAELELFFKELKLENLFLIAGNKK